MNDMTTIQPVIQSSNRCRPEWRNLTPKQECRIRSALLHRQETPGALPKGDDPGIGRKTGRQAAANARRANLVAIIASGIRNRTKVLEAVGMYEGVYDDLRLLVSKGKLTMRKHGTATIYTAAQQ